MPAALTFSVPYDEVNMWLVATKNGVATPHGQRWWLHFCRNTRQLETDKSGVPARCACGVESGPLP